MKKIILTIASLFMALCVFAGEVPSSTALSVAKQFMNASSLTLVWDGTETTTKSLSEPVFFVYNVDGGGWVIVSAEDSVTPILGYSDTGSFSATNMPENLSGWMGSLRDEILKAREEKLTASAQVRQKWENPARVQTRAGASQKYLTTASWDQLSPYNNYLSNYVKNNGRTLSNLCTGCVATAMAEVLRFHKWPESGTGTLSSYTTATKGYSVTGYDLGHTYSWSSMPETYTNSATTTQKNAVAQLMLDCGVMVEMDYDTSSNGGSGAYTENILPALIEHMGYSKSAVLRYRTNFSTQEWMNMIVEDIDNERPILYSGSGDDGGHQFVCDGYDLDNTMLHINWGWSGSSNGYFTLTMDSGSGTFNEYQSAIFGLAPDKTGTSEYAEEILFYSYDYEDSVNGIEVVSGTVAKGETFELIAGKFYNAGNAAYTGAIKAVLTDKDGSWKEDLGETIEMTDDEDTEGLPAGYLFWLDSSDEAISCTITQDIALGDRIAFWYRLNDGSWIPVKTDKEDLSVPWEWACVDACAIKTGGSYSSGDVFYFELIPGNKGISSLTWTFDGSAAELSQTLTSGTHTVAAQIVFTDSTTETVSQTLVVK